MSIQKVETTRSQRVEGLRVFDLRGDTCQPITSYREIYIGVNCRIANAGRESESSNLERGQVVKDPEFKVK
jgi:hypothetical protein